MIRVADLIGAQLDYWTARAQRVPREFLDVRQVQRTDVLICVLRKLSGNEEVFNPHDNWHLAGALVEQIGIDLAVGFPLQNGHWERSGYVARITPARNGPIESSYKEAMIRIVHEWMRGPTPQVAICRAVVRAAFGEEVDEVPVCE